MSHRVRHDVSLSEGSRPASVEARSMLRRSEVLAIAALSLTCLPTLNARSARYAGATSAGFLLPNGWVVSPAGDQVLLADLPLNIIPLADNRHVLVATSGYNWHELSVVDIAKKSVVDHQAIRQSWFGLAVSPDRRRIWWSGGGGNNVHRFQLDGTKLTRQESVPKGAETLIGTRGHGSLSQRNRGRSGTPPSVHARHRSKHDHGPRPGDRKRAEVGRGRSASLRRGASAMAGCSSSRTGPAAWSW